MSNPTTNPLAGSGFATMADALKATDTSTIPSIDINSLMDIQRRNVEAVRFVNQVAFDSLQTFAGRQAELMHKGLDEAKSLIKDIMSLPAHEEKVMLHAEASRVVIEKCITNAHTASDLLAKCNDQVLKMAGSRMSESLQELRSIMKPDSSKIEASLPRQATGGPSAQE
jgi:phasin family protein